MMNTDENELLTLQELCDYLMISESTAYRLLKEGAIDAFQIGRHWKIPKSSISQYIQEQCKKSVSH